MATDAPSTSLLRPLAEDLRARRERIKLGGGPEKIAAQHAQDKLTARERIELLIDPGTFVELGIHGRPHFSQRAMDGREAPADGVVTGYGKIEGRLAAVGVRLQVQPGYFAPAAPYGAASGFPWSSMMVPSAV